MVEQFWKGKTVEVIVNPHAANGKTLEQAKSVAGLLRRRGLIVEEQFTKKQKHGIELGHNAAERKVDLVIAVGGDGIHNEVINGVTSVEDTETAVASIPTGTVKIWGHETEIPFDPEQAVDALLNGVFHRVDLLNVSWADEDRKALLGVGFNFDAQVFDAVHKPDTVREKSGVSEHLKEAIRQTRHIDTPKTTLIIDGSRERTMEHFVQGWLVNTQRVTQLGQRPIVLDPNLQLDSGIATFVGYGGSYKNSFLSTLSVERRVILDALVTRRAARSSVHEEGVIFQLHSERPIKIQGDGDAWGEATDFSASVLTGALRVLVPQQQETTVFQWPGINVAWSTPSTVR